jgi:hypothetical protein
MRNFGKNNNPFSQTYNPGRKNHPNFSWANAQNQQKPQASQPGYAAQNNSQLETIPKNFIQDTKNFANDTKTKILAQCVSIKNLENQVGQIATTLTSRPNGSFPSTTETLTSTSIDKGKETCKVIHLRSGNEYEGLIMGTLVTKEPQRRPVDDPAASQSRPQLSPAIN